MKFIVVIALALFLTSAAQAGPVQKVAGKGRAAVQKVTQFRPLQNRRGRVRGLLSRVRVFKRCG